MNRVVAVLLGSLILVALPLSAMGCGGASAPAAEPGGTAQPGPTPAPGGPEPGQPPTWPVCDVPGATELPFPPDAIERTWPLGPSRTLIACREVKDVVFYVAAGGRAEPVVGGSERGEVLSVTPEKVEFMVRPGGDTPFVSFPSLVVYHVAIATREKRPLYWDPRQEVEFGGWLEGHLLTGVRLEQGEVVVEFTTRPEFLASYGGPAGHIPHTHTWWDAAQEALMLQFKGTRATPEAVAQAAAASSAAGAAVSGLAVVDAPEAPGDTCLMVRLPKPLPFRATHTFGEVCTLRLQFQVAGEAAGPEEDLKDETGSRPAYTPHPLGRYGPAR